MSANMAVVAVVPAAYTLVPDLDIGFQPDQLVFRADSGNFFFSFDGVVDHGLVKAADTSPLVIWTKQRKIWVKQSGGAAAARVMAYTSS